MAGRGRHEGSLSLSLSLSRGHKIQLDSDCQKASTATAMRAIVAQFSRMMSLFAALASASFFLGVVQASSEGGYCSPIKSCYEITNSGTCSASFDCQFGHCSYIGDSVICDQDCQASTNGNSCFDLDTQRRCERYPANCHWIKHETENSDNAISGDDDDDEDDVVDDDDGILCPENEENDEEDSVPTEDVGIDIPTTEDSVDGGVNAAEEDDDGQMARQRHRRRRRLVGES